MSKMRYTIIFTLFILIVMSVAAALMIPAKPNDGKAHIIWVAGNDPNKQLVADTFNEKSKDTFVTLDADNGGTTKTLVQCTAGIGGDVIDSVNEYSIQVYQNAGILLKLDDQVKKYGFSLDTLNKQVQKLCTVESIDRDGNVISGQYTYPATVDNDFIIYNKALFDKYGVPYPSNDLTWEEYIDIAQKLTVYNKPGDLIPEAFGALGTKPKFLVILWEKGGDLYKDNCTASGMDTPAALEALKFYRDLFGKYKAEPTSAVKSGVQTSGTGSVASSSNHAWLGCGKVAMVWGGRWYLKELRVYSAYNKKLKERWDKENPGKPWPHVGLKYGACQVPRFRNSKRYNMTYTGRTVGINAKTHHMESSLKFLGYFASPEYNRFICEISGAKPPNKKYWKPEFFYNSKYPEEKPVHDASLKAVESGRCMQRSPFIETSTSMRILNDALEVISIDNTLSDDELKRIAQDVVNKTNAEIARRVERNKNLKKVYEQRRKQL